MLTLSALHPTPHLFPYSLYTQKYYNLETVNKSSFTFNSDIRRQSNRKSHKCGILHTTRNNKNNREEHAFVWLHDKTNTEAVKKVMEHLSQYKFGVIGNGGSKMVFIPYSTLENWMFRYPHACKFI